MKIECVQLKNFRGYRNECKIQFDDFTALVGKNDVGKSSILQALDIFFNGDSKDANTTKFDESDFNVHVRDDADTEAEIAVCFTELPRSVVIDAEAETTFDDEHMLNSDGMLEIVKKYKLGGKSVKCSTYVRAMHPTNPECCDLLCKSNKELKKIAEDREIDCENFSNNVALRRAIWGFYADNLDLKESEIPASKVAGSFLKELWGKIDAYMPLYVLFKSDRENSDSDDEVQDPLKFAVKQILKDDPKLIDELKNVAAVIKQKLEGVADRTLAKLREIDPNVAASLNPEIPSVEDLKWAEVFKSVSIAGDEGIAVNKRGSGVKRLILLSFFRAEAENYAACNKSSAIIYAVEEPETSQHPDNQRKLISAFKTLAAAGDKQVIITTHSPTVVKELDFENVRLIKSDDKGERTVVKVEKSVLCYPSLNEINFIAFDEATEEYHDELYGLIVIPNTSKVCEEYKKGKTRIKYIDLRKKKDRQETECIWTEYIRNQIHHPDNHENPRFTREQLRQSIEDMRSFILEHRAASSQTHTGSLN